MAQLILDIPENTLTALEDLASFTGANGSGFADQGQFAKLFQDALRTYEWVIAQQVQGKVIAALDEADVTILDQNQQESRERRSLSLLIAPGKIEEARAYFVR